MPDIQTIASILATPQSSSSTYLTDEEKKRLLAYELLQKQASSTNTPIYSTTAGLMKLATGALGGYLEGKTERDALAAQAKNGALISQWANLLSGGGDSGTTPQAPVTPPSVDTSDIPVSSVDAPPMGALPSLGPVADSSQQDAILAAAQASGAVPPPPTPLGAETLRDFDAMSRPPVDTPPAPAVPSLAPAPASPGPVSPMAPAVPPGNMDPGTVFNPSLPAGLSEGSTILPNAAVKPVPVGPNGEVSTLAPSSLMANDPPPRPPADIPNLTPAQSIRQGLIQRGLSPAVADGFIMNFRDESGLNPNLNEAHPIVPGSRGGFGLAQWTGDRRVALEQFAKETGRPVNDVNTQLDFLVRELKGPEANAARSIMSSQTPQDAAVAIARDFLRPAPQYLNRRVANYQNTKVASLDPTAGVGMGASPAASQPPAGGPPAQSGPTPQRLAQTLQNPPQPNLDAQRRALAIQVINDPRTPPQIRALVVQQMTPQNQLMQLPDGTILSVDKRSNRTAVVYQGSPKPTTDIQNYEYAKKNGYTGSFQDFGKSANAKSGLTPIYGQDPSGKTVIGVMNNDGTFHKVDTGDFTPQNGFEKIDLGTHYQIRDKRTGQVIGVEQKDLKGAETQKALGKAQGGMQATLPTDITNAEQTVKQIDELISNPGLSSIVGPIDQFRGSVTLGKEGRDALARYNQLQGKAFLDAYATLKGGGQITEIEGAKAQAARARMDRAQNEEDFVAALKEFRDAVQTGVSKLREKAGVADAPAAGNSATTKRLRFNPATGALE